MYDTEVSKLAIFHKLKNIEHCFSSAATLKFYQKSGAFQGMPHLPMSNRPFG